MQLGICCSPLQHQLAARLAGRFERNFGIMTVIVADEHAPLMESWDQASASDAVLLMLDHRSAPGPVKRDEWQSLLDHDGAPPAAILKLEHCFYPKLLERGRFFAVINGNELEAERWVERWLVSIQTTGTGTEVQRFLSAGASVPAEWWAQAVDTFGVLTLTPNDIDAAQSFASEAGLHFHGVVWIGCEGVPPEALTAEIEFRCAAVDSGRLLFVLVHAEPDMAISTACFAGGHSFVIVEGGPRKALGVSFGNSIKDWIGACRPSGFPAALLDLMLGQERRHEWESMVTPLTADHRWFRPRGGKVTPNREACKRHLEALQVSFRAWRRQPELCRELVGEAAWAIYRDQLTTSSELCLDVALFLLAEKRMAEAVTWLRILAVTADEQDEFAIQAREELRWLVDEFGCYRRPQPIESGEQVPLDFPELFTAHDPATDPAVDNDQLLFEELRLEQLQRAASVPRSPGRQLQFDLSS